MRVWVRNWKLVDAWAVPDDPSAPPRLLAAQYNFTTSASGTYPVRIELLSYGGRAVVLELLARAVAPAGQPQGAFEPVAPGALAAVVSAPERARQAAQARLARGWNTWHRASAAHHVNLPTAFGVGVGILDTTTGATAAPDVVDRGGGDGDCHVVPGQHSFDGSFTKITITLRLGTGTSTSKHRAQTQDFESGATLSSPSQHREILRTH